MLYSTFAQLKKYYRYTFLFLAIIPPIAFFKAINENACNIPYQDDYDAVLNFLCKFKLASFGDKIGLLFSQHSEHRILFPRLIYVAHYTIFGNINFRHLLIFDFVLLCGIFALCVYFIRNCLPDSWHISALVFSLGLFNLNNFENVVSQLAGLFNYGLIFLFMLGMYLYNSENKKIIILAVLVQIITTYSGGSGIIAAFFIVLFNVFNGNRINMVASIATFAITVPLYYFHYQSANAVYFTSDLSIVTKVFFHALGGTFGNQIEFLMGIVLFIALVATFPKYNDFKKSNTLPLVCLGGFMLASMLVMAFFRGALAIEFAHSSRYLVYTHILCGIVCVFWFLKTRSERGNLAFLTFSASFYLLNFTYGNFAAIKGVLQTTDYYYPEQAKEAAKLNAEQACKLGIYCIDKHRAIKNP